MARIATLLPLLALLPTACAHPPDVRAEVDPTVDFGLLSAWAWLPVVTDEARVFGDPELEPRFRAAIERGMAARGYRHAPDRPDVFVSTRVEIAREIDEVIETPASQSLYSLHSGPSYVVTTREKRYRVYERATSAIELADGDGRVVWRAVEERRVRGSIGRHADAIADALLAELPPAGDTDRARP